MRCSLQFLMLNAPSVLVVGTGSIGSRHINNLQALGAKVSAYRYRDELRNDFALHHPGVMLYSDLDEALSADVDAVVVANRTDQHMSVALRAAKADKHLFIEKPLSHDYVGCQELFSLVEQKDLKVEMGFMLRRHPNLMWIEQALTSGAIGKVYTACAKVGQYLPDWRPAQDYRETYSAIRDWGGGAVLDLTHELDYLVWWFGRVADVGANAPRLSDLEINVEDVAQILLRFETGVLAQVQMDYLRKRYHRSVEVVGSEGTLSWDYDTGSVHLLTGDAETLMDQIPTEFERNHMFLDHMRCFLERIMADGRVRAISDLSDGGHVLKIAMAAHRSHQLRRFISPIEIGTSDMASIGPSTP